MFTIATTTIATKGRIGDKYVKTKNIDIRASIYILWLKCKSEFTSEFSKVKSVTSTK